MLSTFTEKNNLKKELARSLWNIIFNAAVERIDKPDRGLRIAHYMSANRLLTLQMEKGETRAKFAKGRAEWMCA